MRTNHDFPIDQFIAKASPLRWFDGVTADMRIAVDQVSTQNTGAKSMHLGNQAMWLEPDFGVDAVGAMGVEYAVKERSLTCRCAKRAGAEANKHNGDPCL